MKYMLSLGVIAVLCGSTVAYSQPEDIPTLPKVEVLGNHRCVERRANEPFTRNQCDGIGILPRLTQLNPDPASNAFGCFTISCLKGVYLHPTVDCEPYRGSTCMVELGRVQAYISHIGYCIGIQGCSCFYTQLEQPVWSEIDARVRCL